MGENCHNALIKYRKKSKKTRKYFESVSFCNHPPQNASIFGRVELAPSLRRHGITSARFRLTGHTERGVLWRFLIYVMRMVSGLLPRTLVANRKFAIKMYCLL